MVSLFSSLFLLALNVMSSGGAAYTEGGIEEEITIVENLDIQDWFSVEHTVETPLYGTWEKDDLTKIAIRSFPLSPNSCLVEVNNRLVPGFVFAVGEQRFLAVGANASEQLQLQPTVYRYSLGNAGHSLSLIELEFDLDEEPVAFAGIEELSKVILGGNELPATNGGMLNFRRI